MRDSRLPARDVDGARDVALLPLVAPRARRSRRRRRAPARRAASTSAISALVCLQQFAVASVMASKTVAVAASFPLAIPSSTLAPMSPAARVRADRGAWPPSSRPGSWSASCSRRGRRRRSRRRQCTERAQPLIVPGVPSAQVAADPRGAARCRRSGGARALEPVAPARPEGPGRPVQPRDRALLRRLPRRGGAGVPRARRRSAATRSTRCGPTRSSTRSTSRRRTASTRSSSRRAPTALLVQGALLQRAGPPALGRARLRRGPRGCSPNDDEAQVAAAVGRFDEDNLVGLVLAPRPARRSGSRAASPCATTSGCCSPGRGSATEAVSAVPAGARARAADRRSARQATSFLRGLVPSGTKGPSKMSRSAYGVRPLADATVPHPVRRR